MRTQPLLERDRRVLAGEPAGPPVQDGDDVGGVLRLRVWRVGSARKVVAEALEPGDEFRPRDLVPGEEPLSEWTRLGERALEGGPIARPTVRGEHMLDRPFEQRAQPLGDLLGGHAVR
jgi:hypothetical protein